MPVCIPASLCGARGWFVLPLIEGLALVSPHRFDKFLSECPDLMRWTAPTQQHPMAGFWGLGPSPECRLLATFPRTGYVRRTSGMAPASDIPPPSSSRALTGIDLALCPQLHAGSPHGLGQLAHPLANIRILDLVVRATSSSVSRLTMGSGA